MRPNNTDKGTKSIQSGSKKSTDPSRPVSGMAKEYPAGARIERHQHGLSQLLYASSGVMTVITNSGIWVVPPLRAVWIPAGTDHEIIISGKLSMRTLYIEPGFCMEPI